MFWRYWCFSPPPNARFAASFNTCLTLRHEGLFALLRVILAEDWRVPEVLRIAELAAHHIELLDYLDLCCTPDMP